MYKQHRKKILRAFNRLQKDYDMGLYQGILSKVAAFFIF